MKVASILKVKGSDGRWTLAGHREHRDVVKHGWTSWRRSERPRDAFLARQ